MKKNESKYLYFYKINPHFIYIDSFFTFIFLFSTYAVISDIPYLSFSISMVYICFLCLLYNILKVSRRMIKAVFLKKQKEKIGVNKGTDHSNKDGNTPTFVNRFNKQFVKSLPELCLKTKSVTGESVYVPPKLTINKDQKSFKIEYDISVKRPKIKDKEVTNVIKMIATDIGFFDSELIEAKPAGTNLRIVNYIPKESKKAEVSKGVIFDKHIDLDSKYEEKIKAVNEDETTIILGEIIDETVDADPLVLQKLSEAPHFFIVGQTRSGKSKTVASLVTQIALKYPLSEWYFACGKGSSDYDDFAHYLSKYNVAKDVSKNEDDRFQDFAFIVDRVWEQYQARKRLISNNEYGTKTYLQYNKYFPEKKLGRIFLVIDEFSLWTQYTDVPASKQVLINGTTYQKIGSLAREAASAGVTIIVATQRAQETDVPPLIRANLTSRLIHNVVPDDSKFLKVEVSGFEAGDYMLKTSGLFCRKTSRDFIKAKLPFVGEEPQLIKTLPVRFPNKIDFPEVYIYTNGQEGDLSKMNKETLKTNFKVLFFEREGYEISNEKRATEDYICMNVKKDGKEYAIGIVDVEELVDETFYDRLYSEIDDSQKKLIKIWFIQGKITSKGKEKALIELTETKGDICLTEADYSRAYTKAYRLFSEDAEDKEKELVFTPKITSKITTVDIQPAVKVKNIEISQKELERIISIPTKTDADKIKKGDALEDFVCVLFNKLGYTTYTPSYLFDNNYYERPRSGPRSEYGLDLLVCENDTNLRSIENSKRTIIQVKNWKGKLDFDTKKPDDITKMIKTARMFDCLSTGEECPNKWMVAVNGLTPQAKQEADKCNIKVITKADLSRYVSQVIDEADDSEIEMEKDVSSLDAREQVKHYLNNTEMSQAEIARKIGKSRSFITKVKKEIENAE